MSVRARQGSLGNAIQRWRRQRCGPTGLPPCTLPSAAVLGSCHPPVHRLCPPRRKQSHALRALPSAPTPGSWLSRALWTLLSLCPWSHLRASPSPFPADVCTETHAHTHTCTQHTHTHAPQHTHVCIHPNMHTCTLQTHTCVPKSTHVPQHACTPTYIPTPVHKRTCTLTHMRTHTLTHTHSQHRHVHASNTHTHH